VPFVHQHNSKLVAIWTAADQQKQPDFARSNLILLGQALFKAINRLHRQKAS
jgi:hypothetical protein